MEPPAAADNKEPWEVVVGLKEFQGGLYLGEMWASGFLSREYHAFLVHLRAVEFL